jgi:hypothetical protein
MNNHEARDEARDELFERVGTALAGEPLQAVHELSLSLLIGTIQQIEPVTARAAVTRQCINHLQNQLASTNLELNI